MPLLGPTMEGRNQAFQLLKPRCVTLSQAALALSGPCGDVQSVANALEELSIALTKLSTQPDSLDSKLADYVFFPISQVLKLSQKASLRCLETSLQCIAILISQGWRQSIEPQLAAQIVILCTLMAEKNPKGFQFDETTDSLQTAALGCLRRVFTVAGRSPGCLKLFRSEANFPQLGQTVTIVLDGIEDGASVETQVDAVDALRALVDGVADTDLCASFLPGIISKLTKVLAPSTKQRRNHRVLIGCLQLVALLLQRTLGDSMTMKAGQARHERTGAVRSEQWCKTAASQLKPALTAMMHLQNHERDDVKKVLASLCSVILESCETTLSTCTSVALETLLSLSTASSEHDTYRKLQYLLAVKPALQGILETTLYDWLQSLPTLMQSVDEEAKVHKLAQAASAYKLLAQGKGDTSTIDRMLASSLADSVVITLREGGLQKAASRFASPVRSLDLVVSDNSLGSVQFRSALVQYRNQESLLSSIEDFARVVSTTTPSPFFTTDLVHSLRNTNGEQQIAAFWLSLTALQSALSKNDDVSDFISATNEGRAEQMEHLDELYAFSLSVLSAFPEEDEPPDLRLQALGLRTLALRAQTAGPDFRYELIDALYPVLHTLATPNSELQQDSITTLNIIQQACGYSSVKDLIVDNVDYLTNAVALKLNAFDVSPQAPQVLLMMVRLAGPSLLPYLEDTVESIFAILESYHGYGLLVELLFRVLSVVAEEGAKSPQLMAIEHGRPDVLSSFSRGLWEPTTVQQLAGVLHERAIEGQRSREGVREAHPQRPWKLANKDDARSRTDSMDDEEGFNDQDKQISDEDVPPPAPRTYNLLFKITELTQHFLPSASPSLRVSLLSLIRTTVPAIARHENSFLPLVNTLWPEITSRLEDAEPHVQAMAVDIVGVLCEYAGDFMHSRVVALWPNLAALWEKTVRQLVASVGIVKASPVQQTGPSTALVPTDPTIKRAITRSLGDHTNTSARLLWKAMSGTLQKIVRQVAIPPELCDDALEMLTTVLEHEEVQGAFEEANPDALWLAKVKADLMGRPIVPSVPKGMDWRFATLPS
ncbi:hypothetical protein BAUCODRAFT_376210 [Baudoinia panamericana UAMH 10762]|uniref:Uncharacterized protein n=1 Tax=Baudoinia panamericana (strain UAMH 10762) TaxID=717646 RepID=M2N3S1_BAUPA|nr:uncharacterized protein BAUCODRAFT_376210 [Baudoinia panamericana UAMH 10762]EMC98628.1 hypothetical protein BAUCODRAFT_376210 [Baudoinia panamericana UAMH 10762]